MLSLRGATFRYPGAMAPSLLNVDLDVADGSITGVAGPSDAGKSTLCLVLGGLAPRVTGGRLEGTLLLDGDDVARRPMGALVEEVVTGFQEPAGQLSMVADTVFEEVAFGPANLGLPRAGIIERVEEALERLRIEDLAARDPRHLSGGQQQLLAIAGLLAMRPRHLILDEPTAHLDARSRRLVMAALTDLASAGTAVVLAEGDSDVLAEACSTIVVLDRGRIAAHGPAMQVLADPAVRALGVEEPSAQRLERLLQESGRQAEAHPRPAR